MSYVPPSVEPLSATWLGRGPYTPPGSTAVSGTFENAMPIYAVGAAVYAPTPSGQAIVLVQGSGTLTYAPIASGVGVVYPVGVGSAIYKPSANGLTATYVPTELTWFSTNSYTAPTYDNVDFDWILEPTISGDVLYLPEGLGYVTHTPPEMPDLQGGSYLGAIVLGDFTLGAFGADAGAPTLTKVKASLGSEYLIRSLVVAGKVSYHRLYNSVAGLGMTAYMHAPYGSRYRLSDPIVQISYVLRLRLYDTYSYTGSYRFPVLARMVARYRLRSSFSFTSLYTLRPRIVSATSGTYSVTSTVNLKTSFVGWHKFRTQKGYISPYNDIARTAFRLESPYALRSSLSVNYISPYRFMGYVRGQMVGRYDFLGRSKYSVLSAYNVRQPFHTATTAAYGIKALDSVFVALDARYSVLNDAIRIVQDLPILILNSQQIDIQSAVLRAAEGGFGWTCEVQLARYDDYTLFTKDAEFSVLIYGELYTFLVDSKSRVRNDRTGSLSLSASVVGISTTARYSAPRAMTISQVYSSDISARTIVTQLLDGAIVHWYVLDWIIPAYRLAANDESPLAVANRIVTSIGGVIESTPGGEFIVRSRFPVSVQDYAMEIADHVYTDIDDNLSREEKLTITSLYNEFYIRDVDYVDGNDRLEFIPSDADKTKGIVRVYPSPARDNVALDHTGLPDIAITPLGEIYREEESVVEFVNGKATTDYPIYGIVSMTWLSTQLTGVSYTPGTDELVTSEVNAFSLLSLRYQTRAYEFGVESPTQPIVQFLSGE